LFIKVSLNCHQNFIFVSLKQKCCDVKKEKPIAATIDFS